MHRDNTVVEQLSHQSPALVSEFAQRSLLLPSWLKHWGNAFIDRCSPKKPETLLPISTHKNHKLVILHS